jgi:maltose alpha-D-glucosyltransferase/alpha-amylase
VSERLIKRSPLRDVAGMIRSFHYAASTALRSAESRGWVHPDNRAVMASWAQSWVGWTGAVFLGAYLQEAGRGAFLPATDEETRALLDSFLLEKAVYELGYELNNRPDWIEIPVGGILHVMKNIEGV